MNEPATPSCSQAMTASLFARSRTGSGQHLRLSMLDAGLAFLWPDGFTNHTILEEEGQTRIPPIADTYITAPTQDGWATIVAVTEEQWSRLMIALDKPELLADERFATIDARLSHMNEFREEIANAGSEFTTEELIRRLQEADVPVGPVLRLEDVPSFEQLVANGCIEESEHPVMGRIRQPRPPARFTDTPSAIQRPAPALGQDTDDVLRELGRSTEQIEKLRANGLVG